MEWPSSTTSATAIGTTMATACTNKPSEPGSGYDGAGRPYYTTQVWKQYVGWQDYSGSEGKSPRDGWQPQQ
eukprot:7352318-Prorocentrum_lima.AAC.1